MSEGLISPLPKQHMFDRVYDHMLDLITKGEIKPGERIKDSEWATKLGVSRTPVREAIRKLSQEGLLTELRTGGYELRRFTPRDLRHLYRCRAALEAAAIREVVQASSQAVVKAVERVVNETDDAISKADLKRGFELNTQFHHTIVDACENPFIKEMLSSLQRMIRFYRGNALNKAQESAENAEVYLERLKIKQAHHRAIYNALAAGKEELATRLMNEHVSSTVDDLAESMDDSDVEVLQA